MIVSLFNARIDTTHVNLRRNGGVPRMLAIDIYLAAKLREFSVRGPQELVHTETDRRA